jgi:MoaA/NifB/PqqE/SkfB family radical SAM enzyme
LRKYRQITTELTFRCNAKCPACHRLKPLRVNLNDEKYTITLKNFKKLFYPELLNNLEWMILNGNFGDSIMNKDFRNIIAYIKEHGTRVLIHTNGGVHGHDYWTDVGNILTKDDIINFDLDGLEDTHSRYRINTTFEKVLSNAKSIIGTNRPQIHWKYIVFDYNQHQVEEARQLAKDLNFHTFSTVNTSRDFHPPQSGQFRHTKKKVDLTTIPKKIICSWDDWGKWYVAPDGLLFRCCWTGGHYYDEDNSRFFYSKDFEKLFNGFDTPIEQILEYNYWNKLQQYLQGYDRSFKLCKSQCGKIVSSIEKIEENLQSGGIIKVGAENQAGN